MRETHPHMPKRARQNIALGSEEPGGDFMPHLAQAAPASETYQIISSTPSRTSPEVPRLGTSSNELPVSVSGDYADPTMDVPSTVKYNEDDRREHCEHFRSD